MRILRAISICTVLGCLNTVAQSDSCTMFLDDGCCDVSSLPGYTCLCNGQLIQCETREQRSDVHTYLATRPFGWSDPAIAKEGDGYLCVWIVVTCQDITTPCGCIYDERNTASIECDNFAFPEDPMDCSK